MKKFFLILLAALIAVGSFGQTKISALTEYTNPGDAGYVPVVVGGVTYKALPTNLLFTTLGLKAPLASPTFTGTVVLPSTTAIGSVTSTEIGYLSGVTSALQTQLGLLAPLASPTFTGTTVTGVLQTNATNTSSNFAVVSGNNVATTTNSNIIFGGASQIKARVWCAGSASGTLSTNDSYGGLVVGTQTVAEAASGTHAWIASLVAKPTTITDGVGTTTNAASILINAAPTGATNNYGLFNFGKEGFDATMTAGGTTGNQTINKPAGSVNIAAGQSSVTVTNSVVTANSIVMTVLMTNDATARDGMAVVVSSGSFVITLDAATTAECKIGFIVYN